MPGILVSGEWFTLYDPPARLAFAPLKLIVDVSFISLPRLSRTTRSMGPDNLRRQCGNAPNV